MEFFLGRFKSLFRMEFQCFVGISSHRLVLPCCLFAQPGFFTWQLARVCVDPPVESQNTDRKHQQTRRKPYSSR